jgi:DmsE family decaheme c-type cytochrome
MRNAWPLNGQHATVAVLGAAALLLLLAGCVGQPPGSTPGAAPASKTTWTGGVPTVEGATYVGSETCKGCHEDQFKKMEPTLHGKLLGTKLSKGEFQQRGCEACHGPGSKHLEDQANPANNLRFGKTSPLPAMAKNEVCLQCHAKGKQILWKGSPHESRDVACVTCHSIHGPASEKGQLKIVKFDQYDSRGQLLDKVQYDLCGQCHQVRAMQFSRSSHMPLAARGEAGTLTCTSCHNPHGTTTEKLIEGVSITDKCLSCHADKRGPFLWAHPPVLESCLNCHQAHGSNIISLLRVQMPRLCQQCHINSGHNRGPYTPPAAPSTRRYNRSCLNCHVNIHGSNHPSGFEFTR